MNRSSQGMIDILQPGIGTTIQDRGRAGHRHEGIPLSGYLDAPLAEAANALVGNAGGEAVLELRGMGTELRIKSGPVRIALAGAIGVVGGAPMYCRGHRNCGARDQSPRKIVVPCPPSLPRIRPFLPRSRAFLASRIVPKRASP